MGEIDSMETLAVTNEQKKGIKQFLKSTRAPDLVSTYLHFLAMKYKLSPVVVMKEKLIYRSKDEAIKMLGLSGKLWSSTEIIIDLSPAQVNAETVKVYICPFTGKVFGDNTHPNPQDAIYDWVSKCPENQERVGGLRAKRFFISEDPEIIRNYIKKPKKPLKKVAYTSQFSGKLFNSKESVVKEFSESFTKPITVIESQNQNRFAIEPGFLDFFKKRLQEDHIADFVGQIADDKDIMPYVEKWLEEE